MNIIYAILAMIASAVASFLKILSNRSDNTKLTDNRQAKKNNETKDKLKKQLDKAIKTGDLDEIRKSVSE